MHWVTVRTLLYGNDTFEFEENKIIIAETLRFIKESKRFDLMLYLSNLPILLCLIMTV